MACSQRPSEPDAGSDVDGDGVVVAGTIVDPAGTAVLLAQRRYPAAVAGLWELPGGKVEPGETPEEALRRELREELDIDVVVGEPLRECVKLRPGLILRAFRARIVGGVAHPCDHEALEWVNADELVAWAREGTLVPADTVWVPELLTELRR